MNDNYIELDYCKILGDRTVMNLEDLNYQLKKYNVKFNPISDEKIYIMTLDYNKTAEMYGFIDKITRLISFYKEFNDKDELREKVKNYINSSNTKKEDIMQFNLFMKVYNYYEDYLKENNLIDFSDIIIEATKNIDKLDNINKYKYLIIDEYQDISIPRYFLANKFANKFNAKVVSVGDDWQSIYAFTGSRVDLVYKYNKLFPGADITFIRKTYRNSHELIITAGKFITRNPEQIKKDLVSNKNRYKPIKLVKYKYLNDEYDKIIQIIDILHNNKKKHNLLILSRKNSHISDLLNANIGFKQGVDTRIIYDKYPDMVIEAMSVHKSKGLGMDNVIILNVSNKDFPATSHNNNWLEDIMKPDIYKEDIKDAEERRLFYVALTRTKNNVILMVPEFKPSPYIKELR